MIDKIISGGQTWPEIAALDTAIRWGIPYTGWQPGIQVPPPSVKTADYRLQTLPSNRATDAIAKNVKASDGTFIISLGRLQEPADYARQMTLKNRKQLLGIDLIQHPPFDAARLLRSWLELNHIKSLFVTGSSGSNALSVYHHTMNILESAFFSTISPSSIRQSTRFLPGHSAGIPPAEQPATVPESVALLLSLLSLKEKMYIASQKLEVLLQPDNPLGSYIQKVFNLRSRNEMLLKSCITVSGKDTLTPHEASQVIIKAFWQKLQQTHRLRIVRR